jgi:hypothetical protein
VTEIIKDKAGRRIELRRVGVVEQLRLYKALGPQLSLNEAYIGLAMIAAAASVIDDVPIPFPKGEAAIEALLERLGDDGVEAIGAAIAPDSAEVALAAAGNYSGTPD